MMMLRILRRELRCGSSGGLCAVKSLGTRSYLENPPLKRQPFKVSLGIEHGSRYQLFSTCGYPLREKSIIKFNLSDIGEGIKEVTIKEWLVKPGDHVKQFDEICEVQSDKASVTISSRYDGEIKKLYYEVDDIAQTGDPLIDIEVQSEESLSEEKREVLDSGAKDAVPSSSHASHNKASDKQLATPAVRRIAAENNINLMDVESTGKNGRVLKEDILAYIERGSSAESSRTSKSSSKPQITVPSTSASLTEEDIVTPMNPYVKAMNKAMADSLQIPHFVYSDEVYMDKLKDLRDALKGSASKVGVKLSYMPFIIKAASIALTHHPTLNVIPDFVKETITHRPSHNIGIAMDTPNGLLVPNVKSVQNLTIIEIAAELNRLQDLGLQGKLSTRDLTGGTITLSNIGSIGGTYMKPVITTGQVAIGALGKVQTLPRFDYEGRIIKKSLMNVSWSADHRVIDGATVARFSNIMKDLIEHPEKMVMHLK